MRTRPVRVLIIDANAADAAELCLKLAGAKNTSFAVQSASSLPEGLRLLGSQRFDVALADLHASGSGGMASLAHLQSQAPDTPIVIISGAYEEAQALDTVRAGAQDYVVKSRLNPAALERILLYGIERQRSRKRTMVQHAVSRVLAESETLADAGAELLQLLCDFLECEFGQVWRRDTVSDELVHVQSWHVPSRDFPLFTAINQPLRLAKGAELPGRAWASGAPVWVPDAALDRMSRRSETAAEEGLRSACAFPVTLGDDTFGVIEFFGAEMPEPDEELLTLLAHIGNQVGQFMARKRAEAERENSTSERLLILDSASEGIYGIDLNGCVTFINRSAARMFGCTPADVLGKNAHELFHHTRPGGSAYPVQDCAIYRAFTSEQGCHVDDDYFWKLDGSHFAVDYSAFPVLKAGKTTGAVVCFNDVSEKKEMEIGLRHAQKLEAVGGLAAGIAHEINTPIQFIGDNTRFLQTAFAGSLKLVHKYEEMYDEAEKSNIGAKLLEEVKTLREQIDWDYVRTESPKALEQMLDGVERVATIVRAMKSFSHVDRSRDKVAADLNKALESTLIVARNELKYVADVETTLGELPPVVCHLGDLNQVFLNLLINAAHAIGDAVAGTGKKGLIHVRTRQDGEWVEVSVEDSGAGIPEAVRQKVFEPFFTTKEVGKGTGQGLALARAIVVEKHGGTLTFETQTGKGTIFHVRLPVSGAPAPREAVAT